MKKYEFLVLPKTHYCDENTLNIYGAEGWCLINILVLQRPSKQLTDIIYYFQREIEA